MLVKIKVVPIQGHSYLHSLIQIVLIGNLLVLIIVPLAAKIETVLITDPILQVLLTPPVELGFPLVN